MAWNVKYNKIHTRMLSYKELLNNRLPNYIYAKIKINVI